jgi:hypothetical protein
LFKKERKKEKDARATVLLLYGADRYNRQSQQTRHKCWHNQLAGGFRLTPAVVLEEKRRRRKKKKTSGGELDVQCRSSRA